MAELPKRIAALTLALVFLITTIGFSILIIWQISQQNKNNAGEQQTSNNQNILKGTKMKDFRPVTSIAKLQIIDLKVGSGSQVKAGAKVIVNYVGALASDGTIFDSTADNGGTPATFGLDEVIKGWTQGIPGMKVGGKRRLLIPTDLAYGANPPPGSGIPPSANLVFDIDLLAIQ